MFHIERQHYKRQRKIFELYKKGLSSRMIAKEVGLNSVEFLKNYRETIAFLIEKFEVSEAYKPTGGRPEGTKKLKLSTAEYDIIRMGAQAGFTSDRIARTLHLSTATFARYKREDPKIQQMIDEGEDSSIVAIVDALFKRAKGFEYTEDVHATYKGVITDIRKVRRTALPSVQACMSVLINKLGWKSSNTDDPGTNEDTQKGEILAWLQAQKAKA